jgi:hypothetical protein
MIFPCWLKGNEVDLIHEIQFVEEAPYSSTLLAFTDRLHREIKRKSFSLERGTAPTHLLIFLDHQDLQSFLGEKTTAREPCHSRSDDDDVRIGHDAKV